MNILVVQLARLGDIYTTWPILSALRRQYPDAKIDFLVRKKYSAACFGLSNVDQILNLDTAAILSPVLEDCQSVDDSLLALKRWLVPLQNRGYDKLINLSFSPVSSYLCHYLAGPNTEVSGYDRYEDGYLRIAGQPSSYFYSQVGLGRSNLCHLMDLFADVAGVKLQSGDFVSPNLGQTELDVRSRLPEKYLVIHVGASSKEKIFPVHKWQGVIRNLLEKYSGEIILIGANDEIELGEQISMLSQSERLQNWVGKTQLHEIFVVLKFSDLLIGADSAPMHMASLTSTQCLNLSFDSVNFWETGPYQEGSRVLKVDSVEDLASDRVAAEAVAILQNEPASSEVYVATQASPRYFGALSERQKFSWQLINFLHHDGLPPTTFKNSQVQAIEQLHEVNEVAFDQFQVLRKKPTDQTAAAILDRVDEIIATIGELEPSLGPLIRWYQVEKINIQPGPVEDLIRMTNSVHVKLKQVLEKFPAATSPGRQFLGGPCADR